MLRSVRYAASAAVIALAVISAVSLYGSETGVADGDERLTVYELTLKQDSVFTTINDSYKNVKPVFQRSCFDCHTDATDYPWYHALPLIKGMMDDHIEEGREYLDMSNDFPFSGKENTMKLLKEIKEVIEKEEMPLFSYRLLHWGTLIEGKTRDSVFLWLDSSTQRLVDFYSRYGIEDAIDSAKQE